MRGSLRGVAIGLALAVLGLGCVQRMPGATTPGLRLSELPVDADPARRASIRLVLEGLATQGRRAQGLYERALQVDSSNPYAYIALARHHVEGGQAAQALDHLRRAEDLLRSYGLDSPRAEVTVAGLRGAALLALDRESEAARWLGLAARSDPAVWRDGHLSADELR